MNQLGAAVELEAIRCRNRVFPATHPVAMSCASTHPRNKGRSPHPQATGPEPSSARDIRLDQVDTLERDWPLEDER